MLVALTLFAVAMFFTGAKVPSRATLEDHVKKDNLALHSDTVEGYQQVYYIYNDVKVYISSGQQNHTKPVESGRYVSWVEQVNGADQIFLYDLLDKTKQQLSFSGSNSNQAIDGRRVVWERIVDEKPQIYLYNGATVRQITKDYPSTKPSIKNDTVIFTQNLGAGRWRSVSYNVTNDQQSILAEGDISISYPHFVGDKVKLHLYEQ